jgi:hypothetical protein
MPEQPPPLVIESFAGMAPRAEPADAAERYSEIQVNCHGPRFGELTCRPGLQPIAFDD